MTIEIRSHTLEVLGTEVSFKAAADPKRITRAKSLLEERFKRISQHGGHISKEKLLTFLALSLADDVITALEDKEEVESKVRNLLSNIEKTAG